MAEAAVHFNGETIALMKKALDEAWDRLPPKMQATMLKTTLAERILKSAAKGERSRERLLDAALRDLAA
jgi:macrodomain Ter protein organizer (MatP/YcbG family)